MGTVTPHAAGSVPNLDELASRLRFSYDNGRIWLGETRMILLHSAAMASLRKELVDSLGAERAQRRRWPCGSRVCLPLPNPVRWGKDRPPRGCNRPW